MKGTLLACGGKVRAMAIREDYLENHVRSIKLSISGKSDEAQVLCATACHR